MPVKLENLNWQEFGELVPKKYQTVILPVGTIEAHGVISLGTDTQIAAGISEGVAEDLDFILAPPIWYGVTRTLYSYPGSLTVSSKTFQTYLTEIFHSLVDKGFKKIVVINGHGGNIDELKAAGLEVNQRRNAKVIIIHWWILCQDVAAEVFEKPGGHAGVDETGAILALNKSLVQRKRYKKKMGYLPPQGVSAYPGPATIFLSREGEGYPVFDEKKAKVFFERCIDKIKSAISEIFQRWEEAKI
ncbi:MAG: hypothetical protein AMJ90_01940 [candidate division Zixibacteria bacterium SM23_73_2]|nr:MAG: hypothetical protein AMJ90_01940 [candidate division Zixibacteria bacterium SM23_73_2]